MLLDFLRMMHSNKEAEASHIKSHLDMIDRDIQQVLGCASQSPNALAQSLANISSKSSYRNVFDAPPAQMRALNWSLRLLSCSLPLDSSLSSRLV